jgi:outer membrane receptor protein involved in Fe transport
MAVSYWIRPPDGFEPAFTNNLDLKPERSISFDAGVEQRFFASRAVVDFTYFHNRFQDQIVTLGGSMPDLSSYSSANRKLQSPRLGNIISNSAVAIAGNWGAYTFLDTEVLALDGTSYNAPFQVG